MANNSSPDSQRGWGTPWHCRPAASISNKGLPRKGTCSLLPGLSSLSTRPFTHALLGRRVQVAAHRGSTGGGRARGDREEPDHSCFKNLFGLGTRGTWGREMEGRGCWGLWSSDRALVRRPRAQVEDQISVDSMRSRREGVQAFFSSPCWGVGVLAPPAAPRSRSLRSSCWFRWYIST